MTDFGKRKKAESATETLPLPIGPLAKERYRRTQNEFEKANLGSLHEWTRERIEQLLDEATAYLNKTRPTG